MNGNDLLKYLINDIVCFSKFHGIYAIDKLNFKLPDKECYLICNTDESFRRGKHWIVIYINSKNGDVEYFDSLGKQPLDKFVRFMRQDNRKILHNIKRVQGVSSDSCAFFCLYFIYFRCRGVSFKSLLNSFSFSLNENEKYVTGFIKQKLI